MACQFNILDQLLPGAEPGGTWTYVGWNASDPNGGWTTPPSGDPTITGDNPLIDTDTWDVGIHYMYYDDGCNTPQFVKYWKKADTEAGTGTDTTVCREANPTVDLNNQLSGNDTGNWSVGGAGLQPPAGQWDANTGIFTPDGSTPPGDYVFVFTTVFDSNEPDFTFLDCKVCTDTEQVTVTVEDGCNAGTGGAFGISPGAGDIDLWDYLSGTPDQSITWVQISGTPVTISGGHLGTVNFDGVTGCEWEFKAECGGGAGNDCGDEADVVITRPSQLNPVISETGGGSDLTVTHNTCPGATYEWYCDDGGGDTLVGTTQTITKQGAGDYTVIVNCTDGCSSSAEWTEEPQECDNDSTFSISFDDTTDCIDVTADDSGINSPINTDVWEYKVGNGAYQPATFPLCGCDIREYFDVNAFCQVSGSDFQLGYNSPSHCPDPNTEIDQLWIEWGDGTQTSYAGFLDSFQETIPVSDFLNTYNGQIKFVIKLDTPLADLFLEVQFTYTGSGGAANCNDVTITKLNEPVAYRDITVRRTITFSDGCPGIQQENPWNPPPNCLANVRLNLTNINGTTNAVSATPYNVQDCGYSPTYEWYLDGNLLAGETGWYVDRDQYGYGTYTVIMTCAGCTATDSLVYQPPCNAGVSIQESGGDLVANVTGCSGQTITYDWDYWDGSGWIDVGSGSTHTPANNGLYRLEITCGGCSAVATYNYTAPCNVTVVINNPSGTNMTTTVNGCGGATINYQWYEWTGSAWQLLTGETNSSYDPGHNGAFLVEVTCMGCIASDTHTFNCNVVASIIDNGNDTYTGDESGCGGASVTWLWEYSNNGGGSWDFYSNNQTIVDPPPALYRLTVTCGGCSDTATLVISGCSLSGVNITVNGSTLQGSQTGCTGTVDWLWEYDDGSGFVFYGNTQNVTASGNGDYRLTVTCGNDPNCSLSTTIPYSGGCTNTVSVSYDPGTGLITANTSGCSGVETIQWQYSPNGGGTSCPGGGWINLSSGVYQITPSQGTGCYRAIVDCDGQCPTADEVPVQVSSPCQGLSISFNSPSPNQISYGELEDNGTPVTNYLIKWVDGSGNEIFRSAEGSFYDPNLHYPHPSNGVLVPAGDIKPIVIDSDVGQDLDCWNYITVSSYGCNNILNLSYDGIGGAGATTEVTFEVDGGTDSILVGLRAYSVGDTLEVIYDGNTLLDTGIQTNNSFKYWRVPYTYVPGEQYMTLRVTNSTPGQNTKYDLYAKCCDGGNCPPNIPDPNINFIDDTCDCIVNATSFGQSHLRNLCLTVLNYGGGGTAYWNKQPPIQGSNCIVFSGTCEAGSPNMSSNTSTGSLVMPPTLYTELKTEIQANAGTDCFISIPFYDDAVCGGDAQLGSVYLPLNGVTYTFDDPNDTVNFTIDGNPYSNANPCTAEYRRWEEYEKVKNQSKSGASAKLTQATAYNSGTINNQEVDFSIFINGECPNTSRDFRLTWADVNCPCQSWELREDTTGNGVYDTLVDSNPNWTGTCT